MVEQIKATGRRISICKNKNKGLSLLHEGKHRENNEEILPTKKSTYYNKIAHICNYFFITTTICQDKEVFAYLVY